YIAPNATPWAYLNFFYNYHTGQFYMGSGSAFDIVISSEQQLLLYSTNLKTNHSVLDDGSGNMVINGSVTVNGFKMATGAYAGYYLQSDSSGVASWVSVSPASYPDITDVAGVSVSLGT